MKVAKKAETMRYINDVIRKFPDEKQTAFYFEKYLGSNDGDIYLKVNIDTGEQRTIMRVSNRIFKWVKLRPLPSQFLNVRYFTFD